MIRNRLDGEPEGTYPYITRVNTDSLVRVQIGAKIKDRIFPHNLFGVIYVYKLDAPILFGIFILFRGANANRFFLHRHPFQLVC